EADDLSKSPEMIRLFEESEVRKIIGDYPGNNADYINALYGKQSNANVKLYTMIWKPLEKALNGIKIAYVSPSGLLHKISFAALNKKKNVYLGDEVNIHLVSSTAKVVLPEKYNFDPGKKVSVYGAINYTSDSLKADPDEAGWEYLSATRLETEEITRILREGGSNVNYFSGKLASEEEFKRSSPESSLIHIATHGFFYPDPEEASLSGAASQSADPTKKQSATILKNQKKDSLKNDLNEKEKIIFRGGREGFGVWTFVKNQNPLMRAGLVLAGANNVWSTKLKPGNEEDGVLTAAEVSSLDLRKTGLVVLSACETGLGDIRGSEGVYGLQRAFKMAGVKFIIMSLWQVPDRETSEFMTAFYSKLIQEKDIKKAFAETQKEMRKRYDPYYWAAFVLME
ncbi:MAG: CHAT domain-containing protein, partial [Bacteroidia bacterium]